MRRGALRSGVVGALVSAGLAVGGCGGDSGKKVSVPSADTNSVSTAPQLPASADKPAGEKKTKKPGKPPADKKRKPRSTSEAVRQQVESLPEAKRVAVVTSAARSTFKIHGFASPDLTVTRGGASVLAMVSSKEACTSSPGIEGRVASALRKAVPTVRTVAITVSGSGESLASYARSHCSDFGLPTGGKGRIVLTRRGTGDAEIPAFTVRSRRWTIEYVNSGQQLTVFALKGQYPAGTPLSTRERVGRQVQTGAGRFGLRVTGTGGWVVRVRDGA